jgi:glucoamylase
MSAKTKRVNEPRARAEERDGKIDANTILFGRPSAWACRPEAERRSAPGAPGDEPHWATAAKDGVGTALTTAANSTSLVWFTIADGILTEIFYPRVDRACTRDFGLIVTDGREFFSDERADADHRIEYPVEGVPLYRLINTCRQGRYRIEKTVFAHPYQDAILQVTCFTPLKGELGDYRLFARLTPHLGNRGAGNTAWLDMHQGVPMLFAGRENHSLALASSARWLSGSVGYVGTSDGLQELRRHKRLVAQYTRAENGNVSLTGEVDLVGAGGEFVLAVGLGAERAESGLRALRSLMDDPAALRAKYVRDWQDWQQTLIEPEPAGGDGGRDLYRISTAVIQTHDAQSVPGAFIASLSTPWGESRGDDAKEPGTGGYHLVWPRDLVESAGGLLAAGAKAEALRALDYLRATQSADGHWPQNMWVSSAQYWTGVQLGETAFPVLLVDMLRRDGAVQSGPLARYWPMVRRAVAYIVRTGPSTQQDRWENQEGYTPFTLAVVIASLLAAAELADIQGEPQVGAYLRETADAWNSAIDSWLYVTDTKLAHQVGVEGYYARSIPPELDEHAPPKLGHVCLQNLPDAKAGIPITDVVSPDALALVRFGLRKADDPRILNTVKVIDAVLKVETRQGPVWRRYQGDRYGERADGSPYDGKGGGSGRGWPLLVGERAHYELEAGRVDEAVRLLHVMESFAGDGGMLPEQVWDSDDIPERGLFRGRPSGSAMPLVWAHAEYLKLRRSLRDGRTFDQPPHVSERYRVGHVGSRLAIWRFEHPIRALSAGEVLRIELRAPAMVRWTRDAWKTSEDPKTRDTQLGVHIIDLATDKLQRESKVQFTFYWPDVDRWEGKNFTVDVV